MIEHPGQDLQEPTLDGEETTTILSTPGSDTNMYVNTNDEPLDIHGNYQDKLPNEEVEPDELPDYEDGDEDGNEDVNHIVGSLLRRDGCSVCDWNIRGHLV